MLLPVIDRCRDCHGGAEAEAKVVSTCISCHEFHQPHLKAMRESAAVVGAEPEVEETPLAAE